MKRVISLAITCFMFIGVQAQLQAPKLVSPNDADSSQDVNVLLNWKPSLGGTVTGYDAEVASDTNFTSPQMAIINGTTGRPSELNFGEVYYWRVRAVSSSGNSPYSSRRSFETFKNEFSGMTPAGLNKVPKQNIKWDTIPGVVSYEYELSEDTNLVNPSTGIVQHPDNKAAFPQLKFGTTYYWRVRALHSKDTSDWSSTVNFTIRDDIELKTADALWKNGATSPITADESSTTWCPR